MRKHHIIISIRGGVLTDVVSTDPHARVTLIDHDDLKEQEATEEQKLAMRKVETSRPYDDNFMKDLTYNSHTYTQLY